MKQLLNDLRRLWRCRHVWTVSAELPEGGHPVFSQDWRPVRAKCQRCGEVVTSTH